MKTGFKIAASALFVTTVILFFIYMQDGNYPYDRHGYYTGADGVLHREWEAEKKLSWFLLFLILSVLTTVLGFKKSRVRTQLK